MRVGILSQWFPPETGPASIPGVLARGLVERGHEVTVLTGYPNYPTGVLFDGFSMKAREDYNEHGYAIRRVALHPDHASRISGRLLNYGSFAASATAFGTSALKGIDVLWVYNSPATVALPMWLAKARYKAPIVLHNMDMWPDSILASGLLPPWAETVTVAVLSRWVDRMYASARYIAYLAPDAGQELIRRGVAPEKLVFAPTWIDESVFHPMDAGAARNALGLSTSDLVIGYAGALGEAQGIAEIAEVVSRLPDQIKVRLLIMGAGTEAAGIDRISKSRPDRVKFLGHVLQEDVPHLFAAADYGLVSLRTERDAAFAFPSKVAMILASGRPLLVAGAPSIERVAQSSAGQVMPRDRLGIIEVLSDLYKAGRGDAQERGYAARQYYMARMSSTACIDRVAAILSQAGQG